MKQLVMIALSIVVLTGCKKENPQPTQGSGTGNNQGNVPAAVQGKWLHGTFAMSFFWGYDGSYHGNPFSQSIAFDFKSNGTYEMFYTGETNNSNCITDAFSYFKGTVDFTDTSFTVYPSQGNFRGYYSCAPGSNFDRQAEQSELQVKTYYYHFETDSNNKTWMVIGFTPNDQFPSYFEATTW